MNAATRIVDITASVQLPCGDLRDDELRSRGDDLERRRSLGRSHMALDELGRIFVDPRDAEVFTGPKALSAAAEVERFLSARPAPRRNAYRGRAWCDALQRHCPESGCVCVGPEDEAA